MEQKLMIDYTFARNLWHLRKNKGFTQEDMATRLQLKGFSISRGTYAKVEAGLRHLSFELLYAIREILEATWGDLFNSEP